MEGKEAPADGVITGWGDVDGRTCCIAAYDFTVMAGSMGMTGELKVGRLREMALQKRMPLIWLLDSAGARIQEAAGSMFAGSGHLFREEVTMSGVIPLVAAMLGPCAAGTAYIPGLSDFVPMVVGQGAMALAGPHLTKAVTGEDISMEELGGAQGPLPRLRASATSRSRTTPSASRPSRTTSPTSPPTARRSRRCARRTIPTTGCRRRCSTSSPSRRGTPTTCTT